ncbi:MAG: polynucleotide adenylyltransferase PcnB, partial [Planctomycetaceae bacterium]|nr:polynucleotide adenylyltransferase PcnB [Planctomycetaceae bacterium]
PAARLFEEVLKLFMAGVALETFEKLRHYGLFGELFPQTEKSLSYEDHEFPITFVNRGLKNTDIRISEGKPVTPAFLFAVLLWEPVRLLAKRLIAAGDSPLQAMQEAGTDILMRQLDRVSIPKRFSMPMREIWNLQHRFEQRAGKRPHRLLTHPRFRAAYDFLLLRAESGEADQELADWWTRFQETEGEERNQLIRQANSTGEKPRRRRRRKRRVAKPADPE